LSLFRIRSVQSLLRFENLRFASRQLALRYTVASQSTYIYRLISILDRDTTVSPDVKYRRPHRTRKAAKK